jgi:hypothetical protein
MGAVGWMITMPMMIRFHNPKVRWSRTAPAAEGLDPETAWLCCIMTGVLKEVNIQMIISIANLEFR